MQTKLDDKIALTTRRAELIAMLSVPLDPVNRSRLQGELSVVNAQIKAINTTEAAQLKVTADRKRAAGLAEARRNTGRALADIGYEEEKDDTTHDAAQKRNIDVWVVTVLRASGVKTSRGKDDAVILHDVPGKYADIIHALQNGIHAAARGEQLPEIEPPDPTKNRTRKR